MNDDFYLVMHAERFPSLTYSDYIAFRTTTLVFGATPVFQVMNGNTCAYRLLLKWYASTTLSKAPYIFAT